MLRRPLGRRDGEGRCPSSSLGYLKTKELAQFWRLIRVHAWVCAGCLGLAELGEVKPQPMFGQKGCDWIGGAEEAHVECAGLNA